VPKLRLRAAAVALSCAAAAAGCGPALPTSSPAATRRLPAAPDRVALLADGGRLTVLDVRTGRTVDRLGRVPDEVDQGFGYSASDREIFLLQLRGRHEELVAVSTRTGRRTNLAPATQIALSPGGARIAYVTSGGRDVAIRDLADGRTRTWSPARALPRGDYLTGGLAWSGPGSVVVEAAPAAVATVAAAHGSPGRSARAPWFAVTERAGVLTGRALKPPAIPDQQPLLSSDAAAPGSVFAISREPVTEIFRLTESGDSFAARLVAKLAITLAVSISPPGGQLVLVVRQVRDGNQYTDLDVCVLRPRCTPRVLERNAQLGEATWETG
jgi:hypothetical protein